jgi:hypothetical protein
MVPRAIAITSLHRTVMAPPVAVLRGIPLDARKPLNPPPHETNGDNRGNGGKLAFARQFPILYTGRLDKCRNVPFNRTIADARKLTGFGHAWKRLTAALCWPAAALGAARN